MKKLIYLFALSLAILVSGCSLKGESNSTPVIFTSPSRIDSLVMGDTTLMYVILDAASNNLVWFRTEVDTNVLRVQIPHDEIYTSMCTKADTLHANLDFKEGYRGLRAVVRLLPQQPADSVFVTFRVKSDAVFSTPSLSEQFALGKYRIVSKPTPGEE